MNLQSQNATKATRLADIENLQEELTQYDNFGIPGHPFLQFGLNGLFLWGKFYNGKISVAEDGQE